jgi:uncharacterized protein with LGFP repeats
MRLPAPSRTPRHVVAVTAASLLAAAGLSAVPVVGGTAGAAARPVRPQVLSRALADLPAARVAPPAARAGAPADHLVTAAGAAAVVGLTWRPAAAPPSGTRLEVRGQRGDGSWTSWSPTEVEDSDDPAARAAGRATRVGTEAVWLGEVRRVQVRFSDAVARAVRSGRVELVEPGSSPDDAVRSAPAGSAGATTARPTILSRAAWGADESLRPCAPTYGTTTKALVVHHTAGSNTYTRSQSAAIIRGIYAYHVRSRGWCDIGYNALLDKYGQIFEGRAGGITLPVTGAQAAGFNTDTFGVSVLGTYTASAPPLATRTALTRLLAWRSATFYRNPKSTSQLTSRSDEARFRSGTVVTMPFVFGHRDVGYTTCPGNAFYATLPTLRNAVAGATSYTASPIYQRWAALGGARSSLGPVLRGEEPAPFGLRTVFQGGRAMYSVSTSTRLLGPAVDALYQSSRGPVAWGPPLADERAVTGGTRTDFRGGQLVAWSSATGAAVLVYGMKDYWLSAGAGASPLGFPTAAGRPVPGGGGTVQTFRTGNAYWKSGLGIRSVLGPVLTAYLGVGGPTGRLGFPVAERVVTSAGVAQRFEHGTITVPTGGSPRVTYR